MCVSHQKWRYTSITLYDFTRDNFNWNNVRFECSQGTHKMVFACQQFRVTCILSNFWRICMCEKQKSHMWAMCLLEAKKFYIFKKIKIIACLWYILQVTSNEFEKLVDLLILWHFEKHHIMKESNHPPNRVHFQNLRNFLTSRNFLVLCFCCCMVGRVLRVQVMQVCKF